MAQPIKQKFVIDVPRFKQVPVAPPATGYRSEPDGLERAEIIVEIDIDAIRRVMGTQAVRSKTGKCQDGFVTVKHVRSKKT
jgi:hypothetical protein